ncbi:PEPxxWA-CTERM sorting domain-containing protein [Sphingomonas sp. 66-10]|nr:PEPxxWA-CTERM sorting domain-containing protein [Sphingomonas sp. 66-10]
MPEPATWAMMLIGFFSIGAALRRRGRVVTIVADR